MRLLDLPKVFTIKIGFAAPSKDDCTMVFELSQFRILLKALVIALAWIWGLSGPGLAADQLNIHIGPLEQGVAIADVEHFVQTGEVPPALRFYAPVLTPGLRQVLGSRLQLDQDIARLAIDELLEPPVGKRLLQVLSVVVQDATPKELQLALAAAIRQTEGLNLMGFLKAYPEKTILIDAASAWTVALQLNLKYLESQTLNSRLEQDLAVKTSPFTSKLDPTAPGPELVQTQTRVLWDQRRHRTILVDLYWSSSSQGPLVLISHGFNSSRKHLAYLAHHLASHGLSVAALEHPGSSAAWLRAQATPADSLVLKENSFFPARALLERPKDVSFLLDKLTKLNQKSGPLQGKLNTHQVSIIGHSLGGYTALALAGGTLDLEGLRTICRTQNPLGQAPADWLQCNVTQLPGDQVNLRDKRVAQIIALNPLAGNLFGNQGLSRVATPILMMSGTEDTVTPALSNQLRPFSQLPDPKYLLTAIGASHLSISETVSTGSESTLTQGQQANQVSPLQALLQGVTFAFIQQLTPQAKTYEPFLTPAYAQSFSTSSLPLRLNTALPDSIVRLLK